MSDPELTQVRSPEVVTVTVHRARDLYHKSSLAHLGGIGGGTRAPSVLGGPNMPPPSARPGPRPIQSRLASASGSARGQRGDSVTAQVKVEFGEKPGGESAKVDCAPGQPAEFNFDHALNVTFEDPLTLDEVATKPVVVTVIEVLPKEKKQKEEKTAILGQCTIDLLPLVQGELKYNSTLVVNAVPGSVLETLTPEQPKPEIDVTLSVVSPLLTNQQLNESNLMALTVESLYSPPDAWTLAGVQYMYTAALPMPITAEKENTIVYAGGQLKPSIDKEPPSKQKKWALPGSAQGNAIYMPERNVAADQIEEEDGDFKGKDDREHRLTSEQDKNRVTWNIERRCYMDESGAKTLQDKIAKTRYWPVEIYRTALPSGAKGKKEEEGHLSFHGVAYINLAPLLYPGVKRIRGAYKVGAYSDQDLAEKTGRKGGLAEEAMKIANGILSRSSSSPFPKPGKTGKEDAKAKDPKKGVDGLRAGTSMKFHEKPTEGGKGKDKGDKEIKASDAASEAEGGQMVNTEGQLYVEARSYMMIEISLQRPLVPKRPPEELARRVSEYVPPRPLFPKRTDGAQRAVNDYHSQVGNVAGLILDEFRESFGDSLTSGKAPNSANAMEDRRQKLLYQLNSTGKYYAFKEQLKHSVVKIVREKYLKTTNFKDKDELQTFLSELYVYLVDQMHVGLNRMLAIEDQSPVPAPLTDSAQLKHFAREAELNKNFDLAAKYYQERIARDRNDPDHWLDYGTFCLYINDFTKAEECFKECVSIDQRHIHGLLLHGVVSTMQDKNEAAETFFEAATSFEPKSILAWTMLGLFYNSIGNEIGTEMALLEANKLNMAAAMAAAKAAREEEQKIREKEREAERERQRLQQEMEQAQTLTASNVEPETAVETETGTVDGGASKDGTTPVKATPATPTSQAGSDKKAKARGGSAPRGKSVFDPTVEVVENTASKGQMGNRVKSIDNLASRPGSVHHPAGTEEENEGESPPPREPTPVPSQTIYMQAIDFLLEVKALPFAERALAHHLLDPLGGPSANYFISRARLELQNQKLEEAEQSLKEALQFDHQNPDAWAILGHVKFLLGDTDVAKDCYERTLAFVTDASEMHSIYLRLASIYLQEAQFNKAKAQFLMACKHSPSCVSWLGVGIACYRLGELSEAEDALSEANILNNTDPEVWGYLSLVCLQTGRQLEAEQGYKYAIKLNLQEQGLLDELHAVQEDVGFGNPQM